MGRCAASSALVTVASAFAQQAVHAPKPVAEAVRVHVVNVEVLVTDSKGRPVLDLEPEEFELSEDGRLVPLTNFLAPGKPPTTEAPKAGEARPARSAAPEIAPVSQEEKQRTLVVFVDDLNLSRVTRSPVLERLGPFLDEQLRNGYRAVILDFDLTLRQLTPLTSDRAVVAAGLKSLQSVANEGSMVKAQRDRMLADTGRGAVLDAGAAGDAARRGLLDEARWSGEEQAYKQESLLRSLERVVDSLAGMPGRKALLYVSDGIPVAPGADVLAEAGAQFGAAVPATEGVVSQNTRSWLRGVSRHANAGRVTFYTINLPAPGGNVTAERGGIPSGVNPDVIDAFDRDYSLNQFTAATGGQRLFNADMLQRMAADLEAVYSLGYSPSHFGDGTYHRLSVKVKRAGVSVRSREGYLDKTPEQRQADVTTAALLTGGNDNPLGARVELGTPVKQGRNKVAVPLTVFIPAVNLTLLEAGKNHEGKVSITIALAGRDGRRSEVHREAFPIKVPLQHVVGFLKHDASFAFTLVVGPGDLTVSVTARDEVSAMESIVVTDLVRTFEQS